MPLEAPIGAKIARPYGLNEINLAQALYGDPEEPAVVPSESVEVTVQSNTAEKNQEVPK